MKSRTFVDTVTVYATAGNGGNGCASFRREKFIAMGGPDGGDGGHGGHVILKGDREVDSLIRLYFTPHQRAEHGEPGRGKQQYGRTGKPRVITVPLGTEVWSAEDGVQLGDVVAHDQELIVAKGGRGGLGNIHWKTSTHQAPTERTEGKEGEEITLRLELKIMADMGLVGYPNAGKSSLLTAISDAHPRIGDYPFTTLNPIIGTLIFEDYTRCTVADIPGLIEGAHAGVGLGHAFLRHVERAKCLIYVIDMAGFDGRDPVQDYISLREELALHRDDLVGRPSLIVANKMDEETAEENLMLFKRDTGLEPLPISAVLEEGLAPLKRAIHELSRQQPPPELETLS